MRRVFPPLTTREWTYLALGASTVFTLCYLTPPDLFGSIDWVRIHVFYKAYARDAVAHGRLPLWNPYVSLGRPFLADVDAATLWYPPGLPYLVLPAELACAVVLVLHLGLAGYGCLRFAAALGVGRGVAALAALVFVLSAPIVGSLHSGLIHYGPALCYLPLVLALCVELQEHPSTRRVLGLGLVLGLQLLAGHPQAAWLTSLGAGVLLLARRPRLLDLLRLAAAIAIAALLAAVTLLPLAELTAQSNRERPSLVLATAFAMPSFGWASLVVPSDRGFTFLANAQLYLGLAPLVAGLLGLRAWRERDVRALGVVALVAALLAAGRQTPVFRLFYVLVPGVSSLRMHSRASVLITTALLFLGAIALDRARDDDARRRAGRAALLIGLGLAIVQAAFIQGWSGFDDDRSARQGLRLALAAVSATALWAWLRAPRRRTLTVLTLVVVADLGWSVHGQKHQNRDAGDRPTEAALAQHLGEVGLLVDGAPPPRVSMPRPYARENAGMRYGWSSYTGYAALSLDRVWHHVHAVLGLEVPTQQNTYVDRRVFHAGPFPFSSMSLAVGMDPRTREIVARTPDPRAYVATAQLRVADHREATQRMKDGHDFHAVALVESDLGLPATPAGAGQARIESFAPERVVVHADSPVSGLLILGETYYPGWRATVNGVPSKVVPANAWMRAVAVPAGGSTVVFSFHSRFLAAGAAISLATLLAVLVGLRRRRR